jgi:hypothetical protein
VPCEGYEPCTPCSLILAVEPGARISVNLPAGMVSTHAPCGFQELNVVSHWTLIVQTGLSTTNILPFLKQNGHCTLAHFSGSCLINLVHGLKVLFLATLSLFFSLNWTASSFREPSVPWVLVFRTATAADGWPI